jgi:hypothetical protein
MNMSDILKSKGEKIVGELKMANVNVRNFNDTKDLTYHQSIAALMFSEMMLECYQVEVLMSQNYMTKYNLTGGNIRVFTEYIVK